MVFLSYLNWHYTKAPRDILGLLRNYMIGTWHRFLIARHAKTLFAPWHRLQPSDVGGGPNDLAETIINPIADLYIRILAAFIRLAIILTGLVVETVILIAFVSLFVLWLLWPVVFGIALTRGIILL